MTLNGGVMKDLKAEIGAVTITTGTV